MPATGSPGIRPAADLFVGQGDSLAPQQSDVTFFSSTTGDTTAGPGFSIPQPSHSEPPTVRFDLPKADQAECPRPHLVQGETHAGSEGEPFNLQVRVFPNHTDNIGFSSEASPAVSARLLAAEEGRLSTTKGQGDDLQELGSHSIRNTIHPPHPYQVPRPVSRQESSIHPPQQHPFIERLPGPGMPPWNMPGVPYEYGTSFPGGWYNCPAAPYPPAYPPPNHPSYHGQYAEGTLRAPPTMQNHGAGHRTTAARVLLPMDQIFILVVQLTEVMKSIPTPILPQHPMHEPTPSPTLPQAIQLLPLIQLTPQRRSLLISSVSLDTLLILVCRVSACRVVLYCLSTLV